MGIPDHLICLLKNLYAGQEATVKIEHGTMDLFQIVKGVHQCCILSPCLFNLYAEYIIQIAGLDEAQARIKIARRNINNLRYADDTTLTAESKEELRSLLVKVKEESEKIWLKTLHSKNEDHGSPWSHQFMANRWGNNEKLYFLGSKITTDADCSHEIKMLAPWKKSYDQPRQHIKNQRHYFAEKGPLRQSYSFSSSHAWM